MKILVGNTGLVGTTLQDKINFDLSFNTQNIYKFHDVNLNNSDLYLTCLPSTKWIVNRNIKQDIDNINYLISILQKFEYNNIILISTIDVYCDSPIESDENYNPNFSDLNYGSNRLIFEKMVKKFLSYKNLKIFRLPALFNKHIKKNILYDLLNNNNINEINLNSKYQWYNLDNLYYDIEKHIHSNHEIFNLFTEPLDTVEIIKLFPHYLDKVSSNKNEIIYNFKTIHTNTGYLKTKEEVIIEIKKFLNEFIC